MEVLFLDPAEAGAACCDWYMVHCTMKINRLMLQCTIGFQADWADAAL
jgi:hypothetical protein